MSDAKTGTAPTPRSDSQVRIVRAARDLLLGEGYSAVSTDRLCKAAGVSKTTLYRYFGDMKGVLKAVVEAEGDVFTTDVTARSDTAKDFWRSLRQYGTNLLELLNSEFCIRFDRMMHEQARGNPDIVEEFYDAAYGRAHAELTDLIAHAKTQGFISKPQAADTLADNLLSMWEGLPYIRARLGLTDTPFDEPKRRVQQCIETLFTEDLQRSKRRKP